MATKKEERPKRKKAANVGTLAVGLAVGAALGTLVGMLFAPKKGKESRKDIEEAFYRAKADVARKLLKFKNVTEVRYKKSVQDAVKAQAKAIDTLKKTDAKAIEKKLLDGWKEMSKVAGQTKKAVGKSVKKTTKKAVKRRKKK